MEPLDELWADSKLFDGIDDVHAGVEEREGFGGDVASGWSGVEVRPPCDDHGANFFFLKQVHVAGSDDWRQRVALHSPQRALAHTQHACCLGAPQQSARWHCRTAVRGRIRKIADRIVVARSLGVRHVLVGPALTLPRHLAIPTASALVGFALLREFANCDRLCRMATKPQPVPWEELNDLRFDLFEWLVEQRLAKPKEKPLAAAFKLQSNPQALSKLNAVVVEALLEVELFAGARNRADGDTKRLKELPDDVRELFFDDRVEREADQAMRALLPSIRHIERLLGKTAERRAKRARAVRLAAKDAQTDDLETVVQHLAQLVGRQARLMHRVFLELHPSVPPEDLTLMGYRRLERRIRKRLRDVGFPAEKRSRRG
ncbi:MAG TPA: hypothetical protein VHP33_25385 [Polyangiaceae bacterium]|nr:hypothetical protein [Polyangiaceae bacterium]